MTIALPMLRASSMKMAVACPASVAAERVVLVDSFDPTATDGSDVHRAITMALRGEAYPPFEGENAAENEVMTELALQWFRTKIEPTYKSIDVEERLEHEPIAGTLDVLAIEGSHAAVVDWKTTFREDDHTPQLLAYAYLVFQECPYVEEVTIYTAYLRGEGIIEKRLTREYVLAWMEEFIHNTIQHPEIHRPGEHCLRCHRRVGCAALVELNRQTAATLMDVAGGELTRDMVAHLRPKVKLLKEAIEDFETFTRRSVLEGGPIETAPGKELRALPITKDHILLLPAWPILQGAFTDEQLGEFVEVKKTAMLKLIGDATPKGKGKAQEAFMDRLRAAGVVATTKDFQIRELNKKD